MKKSVTVVDAKTGARTSKLINMTKAEIAALVGPVSSGDVDDERDRRIMAGLQFGGQTFGLDPRSIQNITGAGALAGLAVGAGAKAGDLLWMGGTTPFAWIATDNTQVPMDAATMFAFSNAVFARISAITFAARALKDMPTIPQDFRNAKYWP